MTLKSSAKTDLDSLFILYDPIRTTYKIGGGSSTPARERLFDTKEEAEKIRKRYFKRCEIHHFVFMRKEPTND